MHERRPRFEYLTGIEGTYIFRSGKDILDLTEHSTRYEDDLRLMKDMGLRSFRCIVPWHKIEREPGHFDWSWMDAYMDHVRELSLDPIADLLHHTSFPDHLEQGLADPRLPHDFTRFALAFAKRYPWVTRYTVINEPLITSWFCGGAEVWYPFYTGHDAFVPMLLNVCRAICSASNALDAQVPHAQFVHVDRIEHHVAMDEESVPHAERSNEWRFAVLDLILGKITEDAYLFGYLSRHGMTQSDVDWFKENCTRVDVLGLDYYSDSEMAWDRNGVVPLFPHARGFAAIALEYAERYRIPLMLAETNIRGTITDRISWLRFMVLESEKLCDALDLIGVPFQGFCWYPFIDSTDWDSLVRVANRNIDPQGLFWVDQNFHRNASELTELYAKLARGEITGKDLPAYRFDPVHLLKKYQVENYLKFMEDWEWIDPAP